ncbi:unnamed protein product [Calicophoron daubneyi]|uniref:Large ribosomal subunit protein uL22m n=1 Tax=Calicophoron daubneyi TaxID=300641 RepID=A0AAV2SY20_CALDB
MSGRFSLSLGAQEAEINQPEFRIVELNDDDLSDALFFGPLSSLKEMRHYAVILLTSNQSHLQTVLISNSKPYEAWGTEQSIRVSILLFEANRKTAGFKAAGQAFRLPSALSSLCRLVTVPRSLPVCGISTSVVTCGHADRNRNSGLIRIVSKATGRKEDLWQLYNEVVYPPKSSDVPTDEGEGSFIDHNIRPGEVTHRLEDILYSQKKLWLLGFMIRGLSVDQAFAQLGFRPEKGARIIEQVLEEAIEIAVKEHDFEYSTKIWIENVHVSRGRAVPRIRKGVRTVPHISNYHYSNLYIRLREGDPPELYHSSRVKGAWTPAPNCPAKGRPNWGSGSDMLYRELERLRQRRLKGGL